MVSGTLLFSIKVIHEHSHNSLCYIFVYVLRFTRLLKEYEERIAGEQNKLQLVLTRNNSVHVVTRGVNWECNVAHAIFL